MEPPGDAAAVVQFEGVSIAFDVKPVLQDISFSVERGQTLVLLGPAGCGKSVLLKLTNGLLLPDSGSIRVFGEDIARLRRRDLYKLRGRIGMVFQESALFDSLTVEENVAYRLHEEHVPEAEAHARVVEALKFVELEAAIDKFPSELSAGCAAASPLRAPSSATPTSSSTTRPPAGSTPSPRPPSSSW
jgi:phospholipid/cholesterol/gamma-HCH transport system ATP-binding protein